MQCMDHPLASYSKPDQEGVHRLEWNMISIDQNPYYASQPPKKLPGICSPEVLINSELQQS